MPAIGGLRNSGPDPSIPPDGQAGATNSVSVRSQYVSFAIGDHHYGVEIMAVREIKGWTDITHLPRQPDYMRGVLNLRGVMVPIVDLRCRFGQGLTETTALHIVIVVQIKDRQVGLIGDRVLDIVSVDTAHIQTVPTTTDQANEFLSGLMIHDDTMIALIDLPKLLPAQDALSVHCPAPEQQIANG